MKSFLKKTFKIIFIVFFLIPLAISTINVLFSEKPKEKSSEIGQAKNASETVSGNNEKSSSKPVKLTDVPESIPIADTTSKIITKAQFEQIYWKLTKKDFPKAYNAWGKSGLDKINSLAFGAAELASMSGKCDKVTDVALSDKKSTPKKKIVFYVDCKNKERFYVSESDIKNKVLPHPISEGFERIDQSSYYSACVKMIKQQANIPSTVDTSIFGRKIWQSPTGDIIVAQSFTAKNAFGVEAKLNAECSFGNKNTITITESH